MRTDSPRPEPGPWDRLRTHWPEYLIEALCLGVFLIAAAACATLLEHPASPLRQRFGDALVRRVLMGAAMGLTAVAIIYSPLGARSGAHINPATTLTFLRLGRVSPLDALAYVLAQCIGATAGIALAGRLFAPWIGDPSVRFVATVPGRWGAWPAFAGEAGIAFVLMTTILHVSNHRRWSRYTGLCAGLLVWVYISLEAPVSGMSLNPARSLGPALLSGDTGVLWIYFTAPPLGMLAAAEVFVRQQGLGAVRCAKLHHHTRARCIFHCRFGELAP